MLALAMALIGCDNTRVYEINHDFDNAVWRAGDTVTFEFVIQDTSRRYNVILNVRNTIDFETVRLFANYELTDPAGIKIRKRLVEQNLFDRKTGEPFGDSGLRDIYAHQFVLEPSIKFASGPYKVKLSHMMRPDELKEILSVGIRVELVNK